MSKKKYLAGILSILITFMLLSTQSFAYTSTSTSQFTITLGGYKLTGTKETNYNSEENPSTYYKYIFNNYLPVMPIIVDTTNTISTPGGMINIGSVSPYYNVISAVEGFKVEFSLGITDGTVVLQGKPYTTHNAPLCPNSTTTVSISHGNVVSNEGYILYYDASGNVIGSQSTTSYECTVCNASDVNISTSIDEGYTGDVYNKDGDKIGSVI